MPQTELENDPALNNYFVALYDLDLSDKVKKKNNLKYLSWAAAWAEIKKHHPDAAFRVYEWHPDKPYEELIEEYGKDGNLTSRREVRRPLCPRFWFDDGRTGYVKVGVTINGIEYADPYAIMDHTNRAIPADKITSVDANKAKMRALAKACSFHGIGLYIYEGEDMPEQAKRERTQLPAARSKVVNAAKAAVKRGVVNTEIYALIGSKNAGDEDPLHIPSVAICEDLILEIAAMGKPAGK